MNTEPPRRVITVILADDHRLVREAISAALAQQDDIEVVGQVGEGLAAIESVRTMKPDVIVLDIGLPDLNGIEAAARIRRFTQKTAIVALSAYSDKRFVAEMLRAGAAAYVSKASAGTELVIAIRAVAAGGGYLSPDVAGVLVNEMRGGNAELRLGRREREVLRLIAEGERSLAIAEALHISVATVEVHRRNIMRKLGLHTVAELTRYAVREGIIQV